MKLYTLRLQRGDELRQSLLNFAREQQIRSGFIITCVGALESLAIRMAGATPDKQVIKTFDEPFEIVSLVGTLSGEACHLHIAVSDTDGIVRGGHLKQATVGVTAELVIGEDETALYERKFDEQTGFNELDVKVR